MQKEVYADNVDVNGEAHETVGENIRNGAKSPESITKALQSDDITFDMQALMNVLPFMDSSKKIVEVVINNNTIEKGAEYVRIDQGRPIPLVQWYGFISGEYTGIVRQATVIFNTLGGPCYQLDYTDSKFTFYIAVDK